MKDQYKHLNKQSVYNVQVELGMEQLAHMVVAKNYGAVRLLSAMIDELRTTKKYGRTSPLADGIEKLLNDGLYC